MEWAHLWSLLLTDGWSSPSTAFLSLGDTKSNVLKLMPVEMGPLTKFMLMPLYHPRKRPSRRSTSRSVPVIEVYLKWRR